MGVRRRGVFALAGENAAPFCRQFSPVCINIVIFVYRTQRGRKWGLRKKLLLFSYIELVLPGDRQRGLLFTRRLCCESTVKAGGEDLRQEWEGGAPSVGGTGSQEDSKGNNFLCSATSLAPDNLQAVRKYL